jgi:hypothetical protein
MCIGTVTTTLAPVSHWAAVDPSAATTVTAVMTVGTVSRATRMDSIVRIRIVEQEIMQLLFLVVGRRAVRPNSSVVTLPATVSSVRLCRKMTISQPSQMIRPRVGCVVPPTILIAQLLTDGPINRMVAAWRAAATATHFAATVLVIVCPVSPMMIARPRAQSTRRR